MHLRCSLVFIAAKSSVNITASHIGGTDNILADALSRNNLSLSLATGPALPISHPSRTLGSADNREARLEIAKLDQTVEFFRQGLAPSTCKTYTYASAQKQYANVCARHSLSLLPANEGQVCQFVSYLANSNVSHSSIKFYLSAVC